MEIMSDLVFRWDDHPFKLSIYPFSVTFHENFIFPISLSEVQDCENVLENNCDDIKHRRISWSEWYFCILELFRKLRKLRIENHAPPVTSFQFEHVVTNYLDSVLEFFHVYNEAVESSDLVRMSLYGINVVKTLPELKELDLEKYNEAKECLNLGFKTLKSMEKTEWTIKYFLSLLYKIKGMRKRIWLLAITNDARDKLETCGKKLDLIMPKLIEKFEKIRSFRSLFLGMETPVGVLELRQGFPFDAASDLVTLKMEYSFHTFFLVTNDWIFQKCELFKKRLCKIEELHQKSGITESLDYFMDWTSMSEKVKNWNLEWFQRDKIALQNILERFTRGRTRRVRHRSRRENQHGA